MPKNDTLDALGDAITTILTINLPDMPKICHRYTQDMPKISKICAQMPMICLNCAKDMLNMYRQYAQDMPKICPRFAQDLPKICPR